MKKIRLPLWCEYPVIVEACAIAPGQVVGENSPILTLKSEGGRRFLIRASTIGKISSVDVRTGEQILRPRIVVEIDESARVTVDDIKRADAARAEDLKTEVTAEATVMSEAPKTRAQARSTPPENNPKQWTAANPRKDPSPAGMLGLLVFWFLSAWLLLFVSLPIPGGSLDFIVRITLGVVFGVLPASLIWALMRKYNLQTGGKKRPHWIILVMMIVGYWGVLFVSATPDQNTRALIQKYTVPGVLARYMPPPDSVSVAGPDVVNLAGSWSSSYNSNDIGGYCNLTFSPRPLPFANSSASSLTTFSIVFSPQGRFVAFGLPTLRAEALERQLNAQDSYYFHQSLLLYFPGRHLTSLANSGSKFNGLLPLIPLPDGRLGDLLRELRQRKEMTIRFVADFVDGTGKLTPFFSTHTVFTYASVAKAANEFENCVNTKLEL